MRICPFGMAVGLAQTSSTFNRITRCVANNCAIWDEENNCCVIYSSLTGKGKEVEPETPTDIEEAYLAKRAGRPRKGE